MSKASKLFKAKQSNIKPARNPANFNQKRFNRHMDRMFRKRRTLKEIIFPKHKSFWWKRTHNGGYGSHGYTTYEFKSGNLALVIAIIALILVIVFGLWILI